MMLRRVIALAGSAHPLPSLMVTAITVVLGFSVGLEPWRLALLGLAILANQFSVGLSNDWLDVERDRSVGRQDKPLVVGLVSVRAVRATAIGCAAIAVALMIPLGWAASSAHLVFLAAGWTYNVWFKSTVLSVAPYVIGFGSIPFIVTLSLPDPSLASPWAVLAAASLGIAAHFSNVLPDLEDDKATGVRGLPHRVGRTATGLIIAASLAIAAVCIVVGVAAATPLQLVGLGVSLALAGACAVLVLTRPYSRIVFQLILIGAAIDVVMLSLSGTQIAV